MLPSCRTNRCIGVFENYSPLLYTLTALDITLTILDVTGLHLHIQPLRLREHDVVSIDQVEIHGHTSV